MESNHQKGAAASAKSDLPHTEGDSIIRPAVFAKRQTERKKDQIWTEADLKQASDSYKDQYVEEVALNASQAVLRELAAAGLCDLDGDDVPDILHMLQAIKAVACKSIGIEHPFHPVTKNLIQEPDTKTRQYIGHMVMSADGSLNNTERYFAEGEQ